MRDGEEAGLGNPSATARYASAPMTESERNVTVLPVVEVRRTGTGKNDVLPD